MNRLQYLLTKLAEEASEVAQMALKTQQFGLHEVKPGQDLTNQQRLEQEIIDFYAISRMLQDEFGLFSSHARNDLYVLELEKMELVNKYYAYSKSLGMVEDNQQ